MGSDNAVLKPGQLSDLLHQIESEKDMPTDTWLGKRSHPRRILGVPVRVQVISDEGLGPPSTHWLLNISEAGMCLTSHCAFEEGLALWVEFQVNGQSWGGRMRVVHRTPLAGTYRLGLVLEEPSDEVSATSSGLRRTGRPGHHEVAREKRRKQQETLWLDTVRTEIRKASQAHRLARRTWGLLGVSVKQQIRKAVEQLAEGPALPEANLQRKTPRLPAGGDARIVFQIGGRWRQLPARLLDVSRGGVRVVVPAEVDSEAAEWELLGRIDLCPGMTLVVGLEVDSETLWIPAEVVRCEQPRGDVRDLGLQFNTPKSLRAFQH
jgi:hypothetical protein